MFSVIKVKKYRSTFILIINFWQDFVSIIFYRGQFYHCRLKAEKMGEYSNEEYLTALDTILKDSHTLVDTIIRERSLIGTIKRLWHKNKQNIETRRKVRARTERKLNSSTQNIEQAEQPK